MTRKPFAPGLALRALALFCVLTPGLFAACTNMFHDMWNDENDTGGGGGGGQPPPAAAELMAIALQVSYNLGGQIILSPPASSQLIVQKRNDDGSWSDLVPGDTLTLSALKDGDADNDANRFDPVTRPAGFGANGTYTVKVTAPGYDANAATWYKVYVGGVTADNSRVGLIVVPKKTVYPVGSVVTTSDSELEVYYRDNMGVTRKLSASPSPEYTISPTAFSASDVGVKEISVTSTEVGVSGQPGNTSNPVKYNVKVSADTYRVTYNLNGGSGAITDGVNYPAGSAVTVRAFAGAGVSAPSNKAFSHWTSGAQTYAAGATFNISANTTLTANYVNTYTVTYNMGSNGGFGSVVDNTKYPSGSIVTVKNFAGIAPAGKIFVYWKNSGGTKYAAGSSFVITANTTLTAGYGGAGLSGPAALPVTMVSVPAGKFQYNATAANVAEVSAFSISMYEITQGQFFEVMRVNTSYYTTTLEDPGDDDGWKKLPMECVSWYDAIAFCNKLSLRDGKQPVYSVAGVNDWMNLAHSDIPAANNAVWNAVAMDMAKNGYRLPAEMEWLWAAMGAPVDGQGGGINTTGHGKGYAGAPGTGNKYDYLWNNDNSGSRTRVVGTKTANELGLFDMTGNVSEHVWDYSGSALSGPKGPDFTNPGTGAQRIRKGADCDDGSNLLAINSARRFIDPWVRAQNMMTGFRVVCTQ